MKQMFAIGQRPQLVAFGDTAGLDAFGRLRISEPKTIFEVQCQYNEEALRMETGSSGDGVAPAHGGNTRMVALQINAGAAGGTSWIQSFQHIPYQPGKSQFVAMTGVMGTAVAGALKRFGYGDAANGLFYEQSAAGLLQVNRRTSTSGVVADNVVTQANWNLDRMDGSGPSGITIDPALSFILIIDLQFLGMGRARIGFDIDGVVHYVHEFLCANVLATPYIQTATLPIMAEVTAVAGLAGAATAFFKCAQVASEGGFELAGEIGRDFSTQGTVTAGSGARTHILSLRPRLTFNTIANRGLFVLESIDILAGNNTILWELCIGAAFSVAPAFANVNTAYSIMNAGTGGTFDNLTNGLVIMSGYIGPSTAAARGADSRDVAISYPITLDRAGAVRALGTISLLVTGIGGTSDCRAVMNWREIR